jgi:hypothetical protein
MKPRSQTSDTWERAKGPLAFWSLIVLLLVGAFFGFRALSPHRAERSEGAVATAADPANPETPASAAVPAAGGKPLELPSQVRKATAALPVQPATGTEPAAQGVGLTPAEMAAKIRAGCPSLVLLFSTTSPGADELASRFDKLTQQAAGKVTALAFATDQDPSAVDTFQRVHQLSFEAELLQPAKPEERAAALKEVEIKVGKTLDAPAVLLVGAEGNLLAQAPGGDLGAVEAALTKPRSPS